MTIESGKEEKWIAPAIEDDRFVLPTTANGGDITTFDREFPRFPSIDRESTAEQYEGDAIRLSVIPCMMGHMEEALRKIDTPNLSDRMSREKNRTLVLISEPGMGKTTMSQVLAKKMKGKLHLINCFDRDISELVSETTVDGHHKWAKLEETINDKIKDGTLKTASLKVVKENFDGMTRDDGTIDFGKEPEDKKNTARERMLAIQEIAEHEGIISRGGVHLISKVPGPLFRALKEAKESKVPVIIALDEFTRRRDAAGGDPLLYEVLAGTRPDPDDITIDGGNGEKFTLSNKDLRRSNSIVIFTGNYQDVRDDRIKPMPDALKSRLSTVGIGQIGHRDWAHRIQQLLTGQPVSTVYHAQEHRWQGTGDYNGEQHDFAQYLFDLRVRGLGEEAQKNLPQTHFSFLSDWARFKDGTEQLAGFMHDLAQMENPKSSLYDDSAGDISQLLAEVQREVQRRPQNHPAGETHFDLRLIQHWLEEAMDQPVPKTEKGKKPKRRPDILVAPEEEFGTRLVELIQSKVNKLYPEGNPHNNHIRDHVNMLMMKHGIYLPGKKPILPTGQTQEEKKELAAYHEILDVRTTGSITSIAELLNTPREQGKDATVKAWQEILALYIQHAYPEHFEEGVTLKPEQVISYTAVKNMLDHQMPAIAGQVAAYKNTPLDIVPALEILPPSADAQDTQFSVKIALQQALDPKNLADVLSRLDGDMKAPVVASWKRMAKGGKDAKEQSDPNVLRLLMTLALPGTAKDMIPKLFPNIQAGNMPSLQMAAAADNDAGLAITSFQSGLDANGKPEMVQLLVRFKTEPGRDGKPERSIERAVLIGDGEPIPKKLSEMLEKTANVSYISRKDKNATSMIKGEVEDMLRYGEESRTKNLRAVLENQDDIKKLPDDAKRKTRIDQEIVRANRGQTVERNLQAALMFNTQIREGFVKSKLDEIPELKAIPEKGMQLCESDTIIRSGKISLADMLTQGSNMFDLDNPIMLIQGEIPLQRGVRS